MLLFYFIHFCYSILFYRPCQVQSLARSIDEALSSWSSVRDGEEEKSTVAPPSGSHSEGLLMGPASLQDATQSGCRENLPRSASKLMMAFRDVTVQIDNHNFRLSSSMLESVSLGNGVAKETSSETQTGAQKAGQLASTAMAEPEFPAPPPSEEEKENQQPSGTDEPTAGAGLEGKQTNQIAPETAENSSEPVSSSSTSTSACETMILSLPRPHCQDTPCGTLSTDIARKRLYRIGLNLFNVWVQRLKSNVFIYSGCFTVLQALLCYVWKPQIALFTMQIVLEILLQGNSVRLCRYNQLNLLLY